MLLSPLFAFAINDDGNLECFEPGNCQYGQRCGSHGPPGVLNKPCHDRTNGIVNGICIRQWDCRAQSYSTLGGGMAQIGDILKFVQIIQSLIKGSGGGGGGGSGSVASLYPPCIVNPATGTLSPIPCMKTDGTVAFSSTDGTGGLLNISSTQTGIQGSVADTLLNALGSSNSSSIGSGSSISDILQNTSNGGTEAAPSTPAHTNADGGQTQVQTAPQGDTQKKGAAVTPQGVASLQPGNHGDIVVGAGGVTVVASTRGGNSETVGFYGSNTGGTMQSQSVFGRLCASRPWASGFLSYITPASIFDALCRAGGYQVGLVPVTNSGARTRSFTATPALVATTTPQVVGLQPAVDIWAEPDRVRLGTRTYIFWNSRDVNSCEARGPSFEQHTTSGGASTVPISDASTFSITCTAADGKTVSDSITVRLAI